MADTFDTKPDNFSASGSSVTKYLDLAGLQEFWSRSKDYIDNQDSKLHNQLKAIHDKIKDISGLDIDDLLVIGKGDVNNSAVLNGEYTISGTKYKNKAISQTSMALGAATTAGLKGWYYSKIEFGTNPVITLSDEQPYVLVNALRGGSWSSGTPDINVGDKISIVNDSKYDYCGEVKSISGNKITLKEFLPFDSLATSLISTNDPDDWTIYLPERANAGIIDMGGGAFAEGVNTQATNIGAHAEGIQTHAYGQYSHTEGFRTEAGYAAHAEGRSSIASGQSSHAEGNENTASGNASHAEGGSTIASGKFAHAEGNTTVASGEASHAEGYQTEATNNQSHAEGGSTHATGKQSHAEGWSTTASGDHSHAEGGYTTASGKQSHAGGNNSIASGARSFAHGNHVETSNADEVAFGKYNGTTDGQIFSIGNGTAETSHNVIFIHNDDTAVYSGATNIYIDTAGIGAADNYLSEGSVSVNTGNYNVDVESGGVRTSMHIGDDIIYMGIEETFTGSFDGSISLGHKSDGLVAQINSDTIALNGKVKVNDISVADKLVFARGTGDNSIVQVDSDCSATGKYAIATGHNTIASGEYSYAEGFQSVAGGYGAHAEGGGCILDTDGKTSIYPGGTASGYGAHAEGYLSNASGNFSHAEGSKTTTLKPAAHSEGAQTTASGVASHAEGFQTYAFGKHSHAEGHSSTIISVDENLTASECKTKWRANKFSMAYGVNSHVEGRDTLAIGVNSHVEGKNAIASGDQSHAEGYGTEASGHGSHAEGGYYSYDEETDEEIYETGGKATGICSHAEGITTTASGYAAHAEGAHTTASNDCSHAEGGYTTASGYVSHAEGQNTTASGDFSHAEGQNTTASGDFSHAEGNDTEASGNYSHAEGYDTTASAPRAHAEGNGTEASGNQAHAEGYKTKAKGKNSHAGGSTSTAEGLRSFVHGYNVVATNDDEVAFGKYNASDENTIFSIGIGTSEDNRKNAFEIKTDNTAYVNGESILTVDENGVANKQCLKVGAVPEWVPESLGLTDIKDLIPENASMIATSFTDDNDEHFIYNMVSEKGSENASIRLRRSTNPSESDEIVASQFAGDPSGSLSMNSMTIPVSMIKGESVSPEEYTKYKEVRFYTDSTGISEIVSSCAFFADGDGTDRIKQQAEYFNMSPDGITLAAGITDIEQGQGYGNTLEITPDHIKVNGEDLLAVDSDGVLNRDKFMVNGVRNDMDNDRRVEYSYGNSDEGFIIAEVSTPNDTNNSYSTAMMGIVGEEVEFAKETYIEGEGSEGEGYSHKVAGVKTVSDGVKITAINSPFNEEQTSSEMYVGEQALVMGTVLANKSGDVQKGSMVMTTKDAIYLRVNDINGDEETALSVSSTGATINDQPILTGTRIEDSKILGLFS